MYPPPSVIPDSSLVYLGPSQSTLKPPPKHKRKPSKNTISQQLEGNKNIKPSKSNKQRRVTEGMKASSDVFSTAHREEMLNPL